MSYPRRRSMRAMAHAVWPLVLLITLGWSLVTVAAYPDEFGPQLFVDRNVAERGAAVTITLNGFAANQQFTVAVRTSSDYDQGTVIATLPIGVDANGSGNAVIATSGLATGNYIVTVAGTDGDTLSGVQTAFGVIDPGTLGPRVVRVYSQPPDA